MKRIQALINKETLKYIVDGKKVSKEYILKFCKCKSTQLDRWLEVHNDAYPTIKQAKNLAKCLHIPFAALYMNSKDIKLKSIPYIKNFRTVQDADNVNDSLLNLTIIDLLIERDFLIEAKKELGWESEPFCADIPKSNSSKVWADEIRRYFSLDLETQYNFSNTRQFYLYLRGKIEKKGIFIQCFKGLEVETIRGIAIYDDKMPVIGINDKDRHPGKLFSIIHEIVHIYKQQSSFCNDMNNSNDDIQEEVFCNAVAGEVLVPERAIKNILNDKKITNISDMNNIELLSKKFSVSREVIIRRLYDTKLIGWEQYEKFNDVIKKEYENTSEKERSTRKNTVSKPAARNMSKTIIDRTSSEICKVLYEGYCEQIYDEIFISEYLGLNVEHVDCFLKRGGKMGQLMIIAKYIIDTCSILNQKSGERYKRSLYKTGWEYIDNCIIQGKIVTCSEIAGEIKDKELQKWLYSKQCTILGIDNEIQENVKMIVTENPKMIEFTKSGNSSSSGDAFLIATAISYNLSVITEENKDKQFKIPQICRRYGVQTYSLVDFWEKEGLVF